MCLFRVASRGNGRSIRRDSVLSTRDEFSRKLSFARQSEHASIGDLHPPPHLLPSTSSSLTNERYDRCNGCQHRWTSDGERPCMNDVQNTSLSWCATNDVPGLDMNRVPPPTTAGPPTHRAQTQDHPGRRNGAASSIPDRHATTTSGHTVVKWMTTKY